MSADQLAALRRTLQAAYGNGDHPMLPVTIEISQTMAVDRETGAARMTDTVRVKAKNAKGRATQIGPTLCQPRGEVLRILADLSEPAGDEGDSRG